MTSYQDALVSFAFYEDSIGSYFTRLCFKNLFLRLSLCLCCCAIGCQNSTLYRLFGCVFLVWRHYLRKVNKSSVRTFRRFFLQVSYFLMFLNIHINLIILKTHDQQFTLTTKNHCISSLTKIKYWVDFCLGVPQVGPIRCWEKRPHISWAGAYPRGYKVIYIPKIELNSWCRILLWVVCVCAENRLCLGSVSYTHLTLPTILRV